MTVVHAEINSAPGQSIIGSSTRTEYLRKRSCADSIVALSEEAEIHGSDAFHNAIPHALDGEPFASLKQFVKRILIPMI
jgi:hypothetical protein